MGIVLFNTCVGGDLRLSVLKKPQVFIRSIVASVEEGYRGSRYEFGKEMDEQVFFRFRRALWRYKTTCMCI